MKSHQEIFNAMSIDPRWLEFTETETRKVDAFLAMWNPRDGDAILEPGCGSGRLTALLAKAVAPNGRVLACDCAPQMIAKARQRVLPDYVDCRQATALQLDCPPASFDAIICFNVLPHLVPLRPHLTQFRDWLKPGALLWVCHTASRALINATHAQSSMANHQLPDLPELANLFEEAGLRMKGGQSDEDVYWASAQKV